MSQTTTLPSHFEAGLRERLCREGWFLRERLDAAPRGATPESLDVQDALLAAWQEVVAPEQPANLDKRLEWSGADRAAAAWALAPPVDATPEHPPWLPLLEDIAEACRAAAAFPGAHRRCPSEDDPRIPFVDLWRVVSAFAVQRLHASLLPEVLEDVDPAAVATLENSLTSRLASLTAGALWEQFRHRRKAGDTFLAYIGNPAEQEGPKKTAYRIFIQGQLESGCARLLEEYPVLGRLISTLVDLWLEASAELLKRVHQDRVQLAATFGFPERARLEALKLGLSDPHRGGRAVVLLTFEGGFKLLYKPKDMRLDAAFQRLVEHCNPPTREAPLRSLKHLVRAGYGYVECVEHRLSADAAELERFYSNAGRLLAMLYALGCTDCHHENLMGAGDQLILIPAAHSASAWP